MKSIYTLFFLLLSLTALAQTRSVKVSPPLTEASAASVGMSTERLGRIDEMCKKAVEADHLPGMVVLVARHGKIVHHKAYGMADNLSGRLMNKNDIFRIASQTKAITATAVMMLWEEGKFRLDDPVSRYIPEFENAQVLDTLFEDGTYETKPANKTITIRHLLTHTSGIGYGITGKDERFKKIYPEAGVIDLATTENFSIGENVKRLARLPLHHHPGEKYTYGLGLDVLGYFIEVVSGLPLDEFFRTRIFNPLGMEDTWFYLPESKHQRLVTVQKKEEGKWVKFPVTFYDPDYPVKGAKRYFAGGAGLCSTARDYATFLQMYLNNGELNGTRLLSRTTVQAIMANQIGDIWAWNDRTYGLAFGILKQKGQDLGGRGSVGTFDWGGYFNTQYFADPKEQIIGIFMKQTREVSDDTAPKFRRLVMQAVDD